MARCYAAHAKHCMDELQRRSRLEHPTESSVNRRSWPITWPKPVSSSVRRRFCLKPAGARPHDPLTLKRWRI